jgi:release factor glutamine methyltransferase
MNGGAVATPSPATTVGDAVAAASAILAAAEIEEPRREARLLVATALATDLAGVLGYPERRLEPAEATRLAGLVARRAAREPAARLLGRREFWSLDFALSPETLVPRPDSESVVEAALSEISDRATALRLLDLGTGTGCLLLALLGELPAATGVGIDIAAGAAATARGNARALGLADRAGFIVGSWAAAITGEFDIIVANPPYIATGAIAALEPEVACHDPSLALDGGSDGLAAYRVLAYDLSRILAPGGRVFVELGEGQAEAVEAIMGAGGLRRRSLHRDLGGIARCLVLWHG